jgi:hypothetical protein
MKERNHELMVMSTIVLPAPTRVLGAARLYAADS